MISRTITIAKNDFKKVQVYESSKMKKLLQKCVSYLLQRSFYYTLLIE
jgi:hypothetical protein